MGRPPNRFRTGASRGSVTSFELQLKPERANVRLARRFVTDTVHRLGKDSMADIAELLASELVTNAVLHAGSAVNVRILSDGEMLRVEVSDSSSSAPQRRNYSADAATGRGLGLVEELAADWGTRTEALGKTVWFTLDAPAVA